MKTDDLIKTLSQDAPAEPPIWRSAAVAAVVAALGGAALFFAFIGMRPDIAAAMDTWRFNLKLALTLAAAVLLSWEFLRVMRPNAQARIWPSVALAAAIAFAVIVELTLVPREAWAMSAIGKNWLACLTTIPFLSALPLAAAIWAMRTGAPSAPGIAGAIAGGVSAALGAFLYATHCTDDSPLFVAIWYPLAAGLVVAAGALAGRVALKW
jgi:hypothetical protein